MEARGIEVPTATPGTNALKMISRAKMVPESVRQLFGGRALKYLRCLLENTFRKTNDGVDHQKTNDPK